MIGCACWRKKHNLHGPVWGRRALTTQTITSESLGRDEEEALPPLQGKSLVLAVMCPRWSQPHHRLPSCCMALLWEVRSSQGHCILAQEGVSLRFSAETVDWPQIVPVSRNSLQQLSFVFLLQGDFSFLSLGKTNPPGFQANENLDWLKLSMS